MGAILLGRDLSEIFSEQMIILVKDQNKNLYNVISHDEAGFTLVPLEKGGQAFFVGAKEIVPVDPNRLSFRVHYDLDVVFTMITVSELKEALSHST